jgi:hypothetical protein
VTGPELQRFLASLAPPPGKGKPASQLRVIKQRKGSSPKPPAPPAPGTVSSQLP